MQQSLASGARLAHYRIAERIGAGGMGEVYKAVDERLDRTVALKILPPELVSHSDRVRRFVQEAKAASSLNHPHIVTIHEIGEGVPTHDGDAVASDGPLHYIAMEFVDGETLKRRIYAEKRRLKENLRILSEAAEGLAKAHASGIVHRDLKPDNIMVSRDGYAKVVDFGLAKLTDVSLDGNESSRTALREKTREGVILGTVGYMSPEQVEGKQTDHRSDIFSFGCILYETITQRRPFASDTDVDTLHAILHNDPPSISDVAPSVPPELRRMVRRCLAKDPEKRYQSMKDLAIELRDLVEEFDQLTPGSGSTSAPALTPMRRRGSPLRAVVISAVVIAAVAAALAFWKRSEPTTPRVTASPAETTTELWKEKRSEKTRITVEGERDMPIAFWPAADGSLYYQSMSSGNLDIWKLLPSGERRQLTSDGKADYAPLPTPDGSRIVFLTERSGDAEFWSMNNEGGDQKRLARVGFDAGYDISPDGRWIVYGNQVEFWRIPISGGTPVKIGAHRLTTPPRHSPDGQWLAGFIQTAPPPTPAELAVIPVSGGAAKKVADVPSTAVRLTPRWIDGGKAVTYVNRVDGVDNLWMQPVDGSPAKQLTKYDSGEIRHWEFMPDGTMYVVRSTWRADAIMISDFH